MAVVAVGPAETYCKAALHTSAIPWRCRTAALRTEETCAAANGAHPSPLQKCRRGGPPPSAAASASCRGGRTRRQSTPRPRSRRPRRSARCAAHRHRAGAPWWLLLVLRFAACSPPPPPAAAAAPCGAWRAARSAKRCEGDADRLWGLRQLQQAADGRGRWRAGFAGSEEGRALNQTFEGDPKSMQGLASGEESPPASSASWRSMREHAARGCPPATHFARTARFARHRPAMTAAAAGRPRL